MMNDKIEATDFTSLRVIKVELSLLFYKKRRPLSPRLSIRTPPFGWHTWTNIWGDKCIKRKMRRKIKNWVTKHTKWTGVYQIPITRRVAGMEKGLQESRLFFLLSSLTCLEIRSSVRRKGRRRIASTRLLPEMTISDRIKSRRNIWIKIKSLGKHLEKGLSDESSKVWGGGANKHSWVGVRSKRSGRGPSG